MGAGLVGSQVARRLESHPEYGLVPVGFLDDDPRTTAEVGGRDVPVLGTVEHLDEAARRTRCANLIVAFSSVADARVSRLIQRCQELGIDVSVVPRMFDTINDRVGYDTVGGLPLLSFSAVNPKGVQFAVKYAIDRALCRRGAADCLSPVLLCRASRSGWLDRGRCCSASRGSVSTARIRDAQVPHDERYRGRRARRERRRWAERIVERPRRDPLEFLLEGERRRRRRG